MEIKQPIIVTFNTKEIVELLTKEVVRRTGIQGTYNATTTTNMTPEKLFNDPDFRLEMKLEKVNCKPLI